MRRRAAARETTEMTFTSKQLDEIRALAIRARTGDASAFDELYRRLYKTTWRLCCSRLNGNPWDADDVVQNAFLKAYENVADYRGERGVEFVTWLRTTAIRSCVDWIRHNSRWTRKVRRAMEHLGRSPFDWAQDTMREDNTWRCIWRTLSQFDADKREVFFYRREGATIKDIAGILGVSEGKIKDWLYNQKTGIIPVLKKLCT